jgi:riboflavin-specific deaminase-like protein
MHVAKSQRLQSPRAPVPGNIGRSDLTRVSFVEALFKNLLGAAAKETLDAESVVDTFHLTERALSESARALPYLLLNMVSSADGRATIDGRSGPIGNRADRELFHALRAAVDGVMIGARTLRVERYNRIVDDPAVRRQRVEHGLREEPVACVLSASLDLPAELPLLADPGAHVVILTPSSGSIEDCAAQVDYIRSEPGRALDLPEAMAQLRERFAVRTLLCEGGPHLNGQLLAAGLVDELLLTFAPKLAGGPTGHEILRITAGVELEPPLELELLGVLESESHLFLRYRVRGD